jgi:PAS domain S-box-containing protein
MHYSREDHRIDASAEEGSPAEIAMRDAVRQLQIPFDVMADAMPQMVWSTTPDGLTDYYNAQWYDFTGTTRGETDGVGWNAMFHPDDQAAAWAAWQHSVATGEPYEVDYRLRHHSGAYRWMLGRGLPLRDATGAIIRWLGTCTDIHDARMHAEQNELLSRELSHRIKNIFAVINGLVALSARSDPNVHDSAVRDFADAVRDRIAALGAAHDLARPHSDESRQSVGASTLHIMLRAILDPYPAMAGGRIKLLGDDVPVDDRGATPIALAFHELATNAAKYGALSNDVGQVTIKTVRRGDELCISWTETGGPPLAGAPEQLGFGSRLLQLSVEQQLGATLMRDWAPEGMCVEIITMPDRLARTG